MRRRVVVTGLGLLTPIGLEVEEFWSNLLAGKSGASEVTGFETTSLRNRIGCEIKNFDPYKYYQPCDSRRLGRASMMGIIAAHKALRDSGLSDLSRCDPTRIGVCIGTTIGESESWVNCSRDQGDGDGLDKLYRLQCGSIALSIAEEFRLAGPNVTIPTACAAGNYAIGYAYEMIVSGRADIMIAGGCDSFSKTAFIGFARLHAMAPDVCRPFDKNRKGLLVGEGAGVLILEALESAKKRSAAIYAELLACGLSSDAYHITAPHPGGNGAALAMLKALKQAGISRDHIDYISAHGTGTPHNDLAETIAIKRVFGSLAYKIPISSIKALIGHTMGAASAIEAITCVLSINRNIVPPTWNYQERDEDCDLDYVPNAPRETPVSFALNNAYAFGGSNAVTLLAKFR